VHPGTGERVLMANPVWRRIGRAIATTFTSVVLVAASTSCGTHQERQDAAADYCAIMPDSIGLYAGNPVTQMGFQIGTVKSITPSSRDVRVDFTVTDTRRLPADVKAIIRSSSILADRSLELVGNFASGPQLQAGGCVPLARSSTPKSLSEVIGSATTFVNSINPQGSTNIAGAVNELDQALHDNGAGVNRLLTTSSAVLDSPDQAISDVGSIVTNLAQLTSVVADIRAPLKQVLYDARETTPDFAAGLPGAWKLLDSLPPLIGMLSDFETEIGTETQFTLDSTAVAMRKLSAHAPRIANLLNVIPPWINSAANHINNHQWTTLTYRPPLYRIRSPDGVATCNIMNAQLPGSCANVQGQPYAVDVALLQYVLIQAAQK
jgi:phospholipid/cholesterol/gamma-HCH transport system substrate-binding protein